MKAVLTGPYTLARLSVAARGVTKVLDGYTRALSEEIAALRQAGATLIQIEEPALLRNMNDFDLVASSFTAMATRKGAAELIFTVYFGDAGPLYDKLMGLPADAIGIDFTYSPGLEEVIATAGSSKVLALGLVDGRNTRLKDVTTVVHSLERIARRLNTPAYLTTSCGLEYLPRDRARLKLKHLALLKRAFLGSAA